MCQITTPLLNSDSIVHLKSLIQILDASLYGIRQKRELRLACSRTRQNPHICLS